MVETNVGIQHAIEAGLLPETAQTKALAQGRPWPIVALIVLGAWLSAVPLIASVFIGLEEQIRNGPFAYGLSALAIGGAIAVLKRPKTTLFLEQFVLPLLIMGLGLLLYRLDEDFKAKIASVVCILVCGGLSFLVSSGWLRAALATGAAVSLGWSIELFLVEAVHTQRYAFALSYVSYFLGLGALGIHCAQVRMRAPLAQSIEHWFAGLLLGALIWSGTLFHDFGLLEGWTHPNSHWYFDLPVLLSAVAAGWGVIALRHRWTAVSPLVRLALACVLVGLSAWIAPLGLFVLLWAFCIVRLQSVLLALCALKAVWTFAMFYYGLDWTLSQKAAGFALAGGVLLCAIWFAKPQKNITALPAAPTQQGRFVALGLAATTLLILGVLNTQIYQKETLIREGEPIFVALAPADPRSLMQGDYMRLRFNIPIQLQSVVEKSARWPASREMIVIKLDSKQRATPLRTYEPTEKLKPDERIVELTPVKGNWTFVTDAWFFEEGDGMRWQKAKYGVFRLMPNGKALLVGMADEDLNMIPERPSDDPANERRHGAN